MTQFFEAYAGTLVIGGILAGIVSAILTHMIRSGKKSGCAGCGYRCGACSARGSKR